MKENILFSHLIEKRMSIFTELQLNGIWDFSLFYEAYCLAINSNNILDKNIVKKLRIIDYYNNGCILDACKLIKKDKSQSDNQHRIAVLKKAMELRKNSFNSLKELYFEDNRVISELLSTFNPEDIKIGVVEGTSGKDVIGVISGEIDV